MSEIDRETIKYVLMGTEDAAVRSLFVERYSAELEKFLDHMAVAFTHWWGFDSAAAKELPGAHVSALVYGALNTHVVAMKLLISGLLVPAGNSQRYVLESLATALVVSKPSLGFLRLYMDNRYSTTKAVRDVQRHAKTLNLKREALRVLDAQSKFYGLSSHPTLFSAASLMTQVSGEPRTVLGGCFDEAKTFAYEKEIASRNSLASVLPNIISGVRQNYCGAT